MPFYDNKNEGLIPEGTLQDKQLKSYQPYPGCLINRDSTKDSISYFGCIAKVINMFEKDG